MTLRVFRPPTSLSLRPVGHRRNMLRAVRSFWSQPTARGSSSANPAPTTAPSDTVEVDVTPKTAAMCVIGDEILSGKTLDTNTNTLARTLFGLGVELKRVEVIPDEENDIIESVRRLSGKHDFVFTSGGIGPTHDDITYEAIAKAFDSTLEYHQPTLERMQKLMAKRDPNLGLTTARKRMALLPTCAEVVYTSTDLWVPLAIVNRNVHILPGVPSIFKKMISDYRPSIARRVGSSALPFHRIQVLTKKKESDIADILTAAQKAAGKAVKIGSYPSHSVDHKSTCVYVSFVSSDLNEAQRVADDVRSQIDGEIVDVRPAGQ